MLIKFEVSKYLSRKDLERTRFIKETVMNSKNLHEILEYEKEMQIDQKSLSKNVIGGR